MSPSVKARSYRDDTGITVLYYATARVETAITVDKAALGFPASGSETFTVNLAENEAGYRIVMPCRGTSAAVVQTARES